MRDYESSTSSDSYSRVFGEYIQVDEEAKHAGAVFNEPVANHEPNAGASGMDLEVRDHVAPRPQDLVDGQYHVPGSVGEVPGFRIPPVNIPSLEDGHTRYGLPIESYTVIDDTVYCQYEACWLADEKVTAWFTSFEEYK
jgi:hypothetical protein